MIQAYFITHHRPSTKLATLSTIHLPANCKPISYHPQDDQLAQNKASLYQLQCLAYLLDGGDNTEDRGLACKKWKSQYASVLMIETMYCGIPSTPKLFRSRCNHKDIFNTKMHKSCKHSPPTLDSDDLMRPTFLPLL